MRNHMIYVFGALLLSIGCIRQKFVKSGWNVTAEIVGFILMTIAYVL